LNEGHVLKMLCRSLDGRRADHHKHDPTYDNPIINYDNPMSERTETLKFVFEIVSK